MCRFENPSLKNYVVTHNQRFLNLENATYVITNSIMSSSSSLPSLSLFKFRNGKGRRLRETMMISVTMMGVISNQRLQFSYPYILRILLGELSDVPCERVDQMAWRHVYRPHLLLAYSVLHALPLFQSKTLGHGLMKRSLLKKCILKNM